MSAQAELTTPNSDEPRTVISHDPAFLNRYALTLEERLQTCQKVQLALEARVEQLRGSERAAIQLLGARRAEWVALRRELDQLLVAIDGNTPIVDALRHRLRAFWE